MNEREPTIGTPIHLSVVYVYDDTNTSRRRWLADLDQSKKHVEYNERLGSVVADEMETIQKHQDNEKW